MLDIVRRNLRITSNAFDDDITDLIDAAREDLVQSGVCRDKTDDTSDPLIRRAIIIYCKANFGFDNPDADRLTHSYNMLRQHLSLAGDYNEMG